MTKQTSAKYSPEVRARGVRTVLEHQSDYPSQWAVIGSIASKTGCTGETLRKWVRQTDTPIPASASPQTYPVFADPLVVFRRSDCAAAPAWIGCFLGIRVTNQSTILKC